MFESILLTLYGVSSVILLAGAARLRIGLRRFNATPGAVSVDAAEALPSVTVCIPARNESHAMTDCLERVIASTYPKLEIIVLDDLSGDKTSSLIKAFAHDGVRFVEGEPLPSGWLGKNHALNTLLEEASGTYVLFMDVDTRLAPDSIERLVAYAVQEKADMVSVLPRRDDGVRLSSLFAPLRYFWEVMFHQHTSPAVASSAWLVQRPRFIETFKDFTDMKDVIQPEAKVAARFMERGAYRFLISSPELGVAYEKRWRSQIDTSIRLVYPLLGSKISHSVIAFLDLLIIAAPCFLLMIAVFQASWWYLGAGILYAGYTLLYGTYLKRVRRSFWWLGALLWPVIVLQEAFIVLVSMIRYKRGTVTWKGRAIHLPRLTTPSDPSPEG